MADEQIHEEIERLVAGWDLLRQRRTLRESGLDPNAASVRQPETVERYEQ